MAANDHANFLDAATMIITATTILLMVASLSALSIPSDDHQIGSDAQIPNTISASPALLPDPPLAAPPAAPYAQLSPDITPLLPSPGGSARSPARSTMPIIPSTRSPPNPDTISSVGPDTVLAPSGPLRDSSAVSLVVGGFKVEAFAGCLVYWLVMVLMMMT